MSNRFRTLPQPLNPTMYQYEPQEFIPDLSGLATVTQGLQKAYDASEKIPIPKHLNVDAADVQERYVKPLQNLRQEAVDNFATGSLGDGMRSLKKLQQQIYEAKQPGGVYDLYEKNYMAAQDYQKQIEKLHEEGEITNERKDGLLALSSSRFPGSFTEEGDYNPYSGITAAKNINIGNAALEAAKGWKADAIQSGILRVDPTTGTYLYSGSSEFVDFNEVKQGVMRVMTLNDDLMADLRQEADIRGLSGEDKQNFINNKLEVAAEAAAMKEGFVKDKKQFYRNWALEQQRDFDFQKAMETGQLSSNVVQMATGMKDLDFINREGKITLDSDMFKDPSTEEAVFEAGAGVLVEPGKDYISKGIDEVLAKNPKIAEENPGLAEVVNAIPRYRSVDGIPEIIPAEEYNKKVQKAYSALAEKKKYTSFGVDTFEDPKQISDAAKVMDAQFGLRAYTLINPDQGPETISPDELVETLELEDPEDLSKRFVPVGVTRADSPWGMNSYLMAGKTSEGKVFHVIASPTDEKAANYAKPFQHLLQPTWDMKMKETKPVPIYNPNDNTTLYYKSVREMEYNEDTGEMEENIIFFEGTPDPETNKIEQWVPTDLTKEDITEAATRSNPFHPGKRK